MLGRAPTLRCPCAAAASRHCWLAPLPRKAAPLLPCQSAGPAGTLGSTRRGCLPGCQPGRPQHRRQHAGILCMAQPLRVARVSSQVKREVGEMLANDQTLRQAVCGSRHQSDAVTAVAGVTDVYVSNDLQVVKIYVSIYSDPKGKRQAFMNLQRLEGYVRRRLGQRLTLRLTPEVRFVYDNSLEESERVIKILQDEEVRLYGAPQTADSTASITDAAGEAAAVMEGEEEEEEEEWEDEPEPEAYSSEDIFRQPGPFDSMFVDTAAASSRQSRKPAGPGRKQGAAQHKGPNS